ncbi:MAG: DUF2061 domain-containing protein [Thiolinea sp.]
MFSASHCWPAPVFYRGNRQLSGFIVMTLIGYWYTGSLSNAASLAGSSMVSGFVFYFVHEKIWQKISWGKLSA